METDDLISSNKNKLDDDLISLFIESWSLEEFIQLHGKMCIGYYPMRNKGCVSFQRCRFGSSDKGYVYTFVSIRLGIITPEFIVDNKDSLRVGKVHDAVYVLYNNAGHKNWTEVSI